jgi:hypothetical protein
MNLHLDDLIIIAAKLNSKDILQCWLWLVKDFKEMLMVSKTGDLFCQAHDESIHWLATDTGTLTKVATNLEEFNLLLKVDDNIDNWFMPSLVEQLISAGKLLEDNQVYSYNKLPVLGGEYAIDNIEPTDASVHFALTGQICEQISKLPDGTFVKINVVD